MAKRKATQADIPDLKRCVTQASLEKFFSPTTTAKQSSGSSSSSAAPKVVLTPEYYNIHIYSDSEIENAKGLQKDFRKFWNEKAREICADKGVRAKLRNTSAIKGAIFTSWTLHKTHILKMKADEIEQEAKVAHPDEVNHDLLLTSMRRNVDKMLQAYAATIAKSEEISESTERQEKEKELHQEMSDLKKAQDALQKSMERRQSAIIFVKQDLRSSL